MSDPARAWERGGSSALDSAGHLGSIGSSSQSSGKGWALGRLAPPDRPMRGSRWSLLVVPLPRLPALFGRLVLFETG